MARLRVTPLGGVHEIGKSMTAVEYDGQIVLVDAGVRFPEEEMRGIDLMVPDVSAIAARRESLRALLLTHGHEDHIGAVPFVLPFLADADHPLPIYGLPLTVGFVREKLREARIEHLADLRPVEPHKQYQVGPFRTEFVRVAHSIPDAAAIALHSPVGVAIFTGDFKMDPRLPPSQRTDRRRLAALGDCGVLVLLSDTTRAETLGETPSERIVTASLERIIRDSPGRVIISTFASNIARLAEVLKAATGAGRQAALVGRSLEQNARVAAELGYLTPEGPISTLDSVLRLPRAQQLLFTTGAQGEATAALSRIAAGTHRRVKIEPDDTVVISATPVPGNETTVAETIDALFERGANVIYPALDPSVHVSGHASRPQLAEMLRLVRPRFVVPVHGQYRQFALYVGLCRSLGIDADRIQIPQLGEPLEFSADSVQRGEPVESGTLLVDRLAAGGREHTILRKGGQLTDEGIVLVAVVVDRARGRLVGEPILTGQNFAADGLLEAAGNALRKELSRSAPDLPAYGELVGLTKATVGRSIYLTTKLRPLILPLIAEV